MAKNGDRQAGSRRSRFSFIFIPRFGSGLCIALHFFSSNIYYTLTLSFRTSLFFCYFDYLLYWLLELMYQQDSPVDFVFFTILRSRCLGLAAFGNQTQDSFRFRDSCATFYSSILSLSALCFSNRRILTSPALLYFSC